MNSIVGYAGFVNLLQFYNFDYFYNSKKYKYNFINIIEECS